MKNVMALLGFFAFESPKRGFDKISKDTDYRYARVEKIANVPEFHAIGSQEQTLYIEGKVNAIEGGKDPLLLLRVMASQKEAYPLFLGDGDYLGSFIVQHISEDRGKIFGNGVGLEIGFGIELIRVDEEGVLSWLF